MQLRQSITILLANSIGLVSFSALSADIEVIKSIDSTAYTYKTTIDDKAGDSKYALLIEPEVTALVNSKKLSASLNAKHTQVEQSGTDDVANEESEDKGFTNFQLKSNLALVDNVLDMFINGSQSYRTNQQTDNFVSDKVLFSGELTAIKQYGGGVNFVSPNPKWIGINAQSIFSKTKSDKTLDSLSSLSSQNSSLNTSIYSGNALKRIRFQLSGRTTETSRASNSDFISESVNASVNIGLFNDIKWVINGNQVEYEFGENQSNSNRNFINTTSYGSGLRWEPRIGRHIELTYNELEEGNNKTDYIGIDTLWTFSTRTSLYVNYSKRFYGDAYQADFNYKLKHFKTSFNYNESVTSFSRLNFSTGAVSLFVCNIGSDDFSECFQPEDINYVLQPGEEFQSAASIIADVTDEVILSKSGNWNFGYDKGRFKTSLNLRYNKTQYLESDRVQKNQNISLSASYKLGKKTNLSINSNYAIREELQSDNEVESKSISIMLDKKVSNNTKAILTYRYLGRTPQAVTETQTEIKDSRLTLGVNYKF